MNFVQCIAMDARDTMDALCLQLVFPLVVTKDDLDTKKTSTKTRYSKVILKINNFKKKTKDYSYWKSFFQNLQHCLVLLITATTSIPWRKPVEQMRLYLSRTKKASHRINASGNQHGDHSEKSWALDTTRLIFVQLSSPWKNTGRTRLPFLKRDDGEP